MVHGPHEHILRALFLIAAEGVTDMAADPGEHLVGDHPCHAEGRVVSIVFATRHPAIQDPFLM